MPALCVGITFWLEGAWSYLVVGKFFPRIFVCIKQWLLKEKKHCLTLIHAKMKETLLILLAMLLIGILLPFL